MSNDERPILGIARVLNDEQAPAWLEQNIKAVALEQARLRTQTGPDRGSKVTRTSRQWFASLNRSWLPIAGSVASLLLVVLLVTGNPTPPVTTTTEASLPAKVPSPAVSAAPAQAAAPAIPEAPSLPASAATPAAPAAPAAPRIPAAPATPGRATAQVDEPRRLERSRATSEPDTAKRKLAKEPGSNELNNRASPDAGVAADRQLPAASDAPNLAQPAAPPAPAPAPAPAKPMAPFVGEAAPSAAAPTEQRTQTLRKDGAANASGAKLEQDLLPESAAQCVAQVQTLISEQREVDARRLFRRCGERFADLTWPESIRQRLGGEAATTR